MFGCGSPQPDTAWHLDWRYRVPIEVFVGAESRGEVLAEAHIGTLPGEVSARRSAAARLVEVGPLQAGAHQEVPFQLEASGSAGPDRLVFRVSGPNSKGRTRRYWFYFDPHRQAAAPLYPAAISVGKEQEIDGHLALRVRTSRATWIYHMRGGGFASLIDVDGNDWLSYSELAGSDGVYRGLPNLVHPEGWFHPGGKSCRSRVLGRGPLRVRIRAECGGGAWVTDFELYADFTRVRVLAASKAFWFLYEGTPGGQLDARDVMVFSDGRQRVSSEAWTRDLTDPEWLLFADRDLGRSLLLFHHGSDRTPDSYVSMDGRMTVFGFGRVGVRKFLRRTPAEFTLGLYDAINPNALREVILKQALPIQVRVGRRQQNPAATSG